MFVAERRSFLADAVSTSGTVVWSTRYHLGVQPSGQTMTVDVRRPVLSLYRRGETIDILYDPDRYYPGQITAFGYVDSFRGLWLLPLLLTTAGGFMLIAAFMTGRTGRTAFRFDVDVRGVILLAAALGVGSCRGDEVADVCTQIGCNSGLTVLLTGDIPSEYRVVVKPFGREAVEKTCSLVQPCQPQLFFEGITRESIEVEVHMGARLVRRNFTVPYTEKRPNGPGCEPVCLQGVVTVVIE